MLGLLFATSLHLRFSRLAESGRQGKRYVGLPEMNSICKALISEPGVESKYGVGVGKMEWLSDENVWMLIGSDGSTLGHFAGVVASDKNVVSPRIKEVTGRDPPLDTIEGILDQKLINLKMGSL